MRNSRYTSVLGTDLRSGAGLFGRPPSSGASLPGEDARLLAVKEVSQIIEQPKSACVWRSPHGVLVASDANYPRPAGLAARHWRFQRPLTAS